MAPATDAPARVEPFGADGAEACREAWRELGARSPDRNPFWEPDFALPAAALPGVAPPLFVAAWRGERMTALLVLRRPRLGRLATVLRGWAHDQAVLGTPLLDPVYGAEDLAAIVAWLRRAFPLAQAVLLPWMDEDSQAGAQIEAATGRSAIRLGAHERAALFRESAEAGAAPAVSAKRGKELARLRRRLAERGDLLSRSAVTPMEVEQACASFAALEARGWKGRRGTAFASDPARLKFLQAVTMGFARRGECRIDLLTLDGAAITVGIVLGGDARALYWKTTYDEAFSVYSPGVLLTQVLTERQLSNPALRLTDSCAVSGHPMIDRLWPGRLQIADWWLPLRAGHTALLAAERIRRALRAVAKAAWKRLRP
ncbi:GNAT family N-acetyltransferase [Alsobacter soli]|nr:GNAT family N-acetyltransferase [Alsobacter soli]